MRLFYTIKSYTKLLYVKLYGMLFKINNTFKSHVKIT